MGRHNKGTDWNAVVLAVTIAVLIVAFILTIVFYPEGGPKWRVP